MIVPRPYQQKIVDEVSAKFRAGAGSVLMQLGTGGGKTATASCILARAVERGYRCAFFAHLDSLIEDTHERLVRAGVRAGFVQAGRPVDPEAPIQVCSLKTLFVRGDRPPAQLVVFDEAHRAVGPSARVILEAYPEAALLGLTATPQRGDGKPLDVFEQLVVGPSNKWLTAQGYLVPCEVFAPAGYQEKALAADPVKMLQKHGRGRRAIVFSANKRHARALVEEFTAAGYRTDVVLGETTRDRRRALRAALVSGELQVLVGVDVFIEGWDVPEIEDVVLARRFGVTGAFLQGIGRGLRPSPATGKTSCRVIDLYGVVYLHGLPDEDRIWSLKGKAVRRAETLTALMRCPDCFAIFRPSSRCPRCDAKMKADAKIPRVLTRPEKLEKFSALPQSVRDYRYITRLEGVARTRMNMPDRAAAEWAHRQFKKKFGREPDAGGAAA